MHFKNCTMNYNYCCNSHEHPRNHYSVTLFAVITVAYPIPQRPKHIISNTNITLYYYSKHITQSQPYSPIPNTNYLIPRYQLLHKIFCIHYLTPVTQKRFSHTCYSKRIAPNPEPWQYLPVVHIQSHH